MEVVDVGEIAKSARMVVCTWADGDVVKPNLLAELDDIEFR